MAKIWDNGIKISPFITFSLHMEREKFDLTQPVKPVVSLNAPGSAIYAEIIEENFRDLVGIIFGAFIPALKRRGFLRVD